MTNINLGIIGTGARSVSYVKSCLSGIHQGVNIRAIADIDEERRNKYWEIYLNKSERTNVYAEYKELLDNDDIDAVIITTPDTTHKEITIAAMNRGKHILLEKPIATTIEDCLELYDIGKDYSKVFKMGFVLRYSPFYRKIKEIIERGDIGYIISIEAKETLSVTHAGSFFRRWHRFRKNNGGFMNAKSSHDIDLLNWLVGSEPRYVSAFGSRSYFNHKEDAALYCKDCTLKNSCRYYYMFDSTNKSIFEQEGDLCVFNGEKDIVDHEVLNIEYTDKTTASFTLCMLSHEGNRTMKIFGSEASLNCDMTNGTIAVNRISPQDETSYKIVSQKTAHGGGDDVILAEFVDAIRGANSGDKNDIRAGMLSSLIALAGEVSMDEKKIIDLKQFV